MDSANALLIASTGKSLSKALIFAATNPKYDNRLFIELRVQYMKTPSSNLGRTCCVHKLFDIQNNFCTQNFLSHVLQKEVLLPKIYLYNNSIVISQFFDFFFRTKREMFCCFLQVNVLMYWKSEVFIFSEQCIKYGHWKYANLVPK